MRYTSLNNATISGDGVCGPYRRRVASETGTVRSRWILAAVSTALFCVQIDYFAMNLALPRMASDLNSTE